MSFGPKGLLQAAICRDDEEISGVHKKDCIVQILRASNDPWLLPMVIYTDLWVWRGYASCQKSRVHNGVRLLQKPQIGKPSSTISGVEIFSKLLIPEPHGVGCKLSELSSELCPFRV